MAGEHARREPPGATGDQKARTKYFFPKYTYGAGQTPKCGDCDAAPLPPGETRRRCHGAQSLVTERCNPIPDWIFQPDGLCLASILVALGVLENGWANSAILNVYNKRGGKLLGHFDSPRLFQRPIIAIGLFSAKRLSFGVAGFGMQPQEHHYGVDMPRGSVTIMEGYAANRINHAVRPVREKVASLLIRRMHPGLLDEEWKARNEILCRSPPTTLQIDQDAVSEASDAEDNLSELNERLLDHRPADNVFSE